MKVTHCVQLFGTPWTIQSMEFSGQEYWSGQPFPFPGDLPNPGIEPRSPALRVDSLPAEPPGKPKNTGVGSLSLLQWVAYPFSIFFLTQESTWGFLHCRLILYRLSYQGSPNQVGKWSPNCLSDSLWALTSRYRTRSGIFMCWLSHYPTRSAMTVKCISLGTIENSTASHFPRGVWDTQFLGFSFFSLWVTSLISPALTELIPSPIQLFLTLQLWGDTFLLLKIPI